jgi:type II secretion system protein D
VVVFLSLFAALSLINVASAQRQGGGLGDRQIRVTERDEAGKAAKLSFFNVVNANIHDILKFMSDETNLTIIASEKVDGKVTLVNLKDITVEEALEALKTALNTLGFTTIRVNKTIVIIPLDEAKTKPVRVEIGTDPEEIDSTDEMITQIMPLNYADAAEMALNMKNLIPKSADIFADTANNYLVITDTSSNIRRIALMLKELDVEPGEMLKTRVFQLKYADARSLEQTLSNLFRQGVEMAQGLQRMSSRGTEEMMKRLKQAQREGRVPGRGIDFVKGLVLISADERTNKLVVTASEQNLESIAKMIEELDTSDVAQAEIRVFLLSYAVAEDVADELEDLLQGTGGRSMPPWQRSRMRQQGMTTGTKGIQGEVNIVSDDRLNAVVVSSDPQNFPLIEKIIEQLDQQVEAQEIIKIFMLQYADAETVTQNLQDLFEGVTDRDMPWWERERRRFDRRERDRRGREETEEVTGIQGTVNLVADTRLNAVVVSTAAANIPILEDLIKRLDITVPDLESDTRIFPLKNADAENVADILGNIYQSGSSTSSRFFFLPRSSRQSRVGTITGTVNVAAYPRTNSLIVTSSSARNFEAVSKLIEDLDQPTPPDFKYSTLIYPLEYSNAEEIGDLLNDIFSEEGAGEGGGGALQQRRERSFFRMMMGGQSTMLKDMTTLAGQARVNADIQTNSLIITTPERNFESIKEIIRQLDIVRGQVWLEITVVEVTLSEDTKLGLEWMWREGKHLGKKDWEGEFGTAFQLSDEAIGFTYEVFNKNLTALLHALAKENKVRVLSTPSLLTRDNQTATLSKGKDIPYLQSAQTDQLGRIIYDYDFLQDIGINIEITPHIAKMKELKEGEKRTVGLDITTMNVSSFLEYTDFNAPVTSDSTVTTYVDVEDGEQIVIGGMIRSETKKVVHKIPILGSIPFLGRLFKKTQDIIEDTELLILITPRIIDINKEEDRVILKELQNQFNNRENELMNPNAEIEKRSSGTEIGE